jgi:anaerobic ribonucleoside-triphosphate reductase activating protein
MFYQDFQVVFQEVPGEISLCFSISGCSLKCSGCHSPLLWKTKTGNKLTRNIFCQIIKRYKGIASCVVFMGGEWHQEKLVKMLKLAKAEGYKTCLYTGEEDVNSKILEQLDWIKTGSWEISLGGLDCIDTNQKFKEVKTNKILNHLFINT